jgi:hypothetical protein
MATVPTADSQSKRTSTNTKQVLETVLSLPAIDRAAIVESLLASLRPPDLHIDQIAGRETHPQAVRGVGKFLFD